MILIHPQTTGESDRQPLWMLPVYSSSPHLRHYTKDFVSVTEQTAALACKKNISLLWLPSTPISLLLGITTLKNRQQMITPVHRLVFLWELCFICDLRCNATVQRRASRPLYMSDRMAKELGTASYVFLCNTTKTYHGLNSPTRFARAGPFSKP